MLKRTLALTALFLTGCAPGKYIPPRISATEAHAMIAKAGGPLIADVRSPDAYRHEHIKGAINVPFNVVHSGKIPWGKNRWAVLY